MYVYQQASPLGDQRQLVRGNPPKTPVNESEMIRMRKRNCRVQVRLDNKEYQAFMKRVKKTGLSQEVYLRHLISGLVPQEAPPSEYFDFMKELYRVGNNLTKSHRKPMC